MNNSIKRPLLSFVILSRNDKYMENAKWRLEMTLDFLALGLSRLNRLDDAEIVIVDWQSTVPLHTVLNISSLARKIVRFIMVPETVSESNAFDNDFPRPIITNVGIRRAKGIFVVQTVGDVLWTDVTLSFLFDVIEGRKSIKSRIGETLIVVGRKEIPYEVVSENPSLEYLEKYISNNLDCITDIPPYPYLLVPADGLVMHRDRWFESRSFDERLQHWGWSDCDIVLRMRLKYSLLSKLDDPRLNVYHLNHIAPDKDLEVNERKTNPWLFNPLIVNDKNWGLADWSFEEVYSNEISYGNIQFFSKVIEVQNDSFRRKHITNLLVFLVSSMTLHNFKFVLSCLFFIWSQYPEDSIPKKIYVSLKATRIFFIR